MSFSCIKLTLREKGSAENLNFSKIPIWGEYREFEAKLSTKNRGRLVRPPCLECTAHRIVLKGADKTVHSTKRETGYSS